MLLHRLLAKAILFSSGCKISLGKLKPFHVFPIFPSAFGSLGSAKCKSASARPNKYQGMWGSRCKYSLVPGKAQLRMVLPMYAGMKPPWNHPIPNPYRRDQRWSMESMCCKKHGNRMQPEREGTKASDGRTRGTCLLGARGMALPLRPYHPQRFIHQKLHPNRHTCSSIFHVQASSMRWLFPSGHITHAASSIRSCTQIRQKCSSIFNIFNAKPAGPHRPLRFSMVHLIPKPFLPRPTVCPPGGRTRGNRSVTKLPPGTWPGKKPCVVSRFPTQSNYWKSTSNPAIAAATPPDTSILTTFATNNSALPVGWLS